MIEVDDFKSEYMDTEFGSDDIRRIPGTPAKKKGNLIDKFNNASPMKKILILFLMGPKTSLILAPVLLKKLSAEYGITISMKAVYASGIIAGKVATGLALWLFVKKIVRENMYLQNKL